VRVAHVGKSSCTFRYTIVRAGDDLPVAKVNQVCALTNLETLRAVPLPDDVRAVLMAHFEERDRPGT
jgi:acyl-CoA thioesterase FadM